MPSRGSESTEALVEDEAVHACPTGALLVKRIGFDVPVGRRTYDHEPIGSEIERGAEPTATEERE